MAELRGERLEGLTRHDAVANGLELRANSATLRRGGIGGVLQQDVTRAYLQRQVFRGIDVLECVIRDERVDLDDRIA